MQLVPTHTAPSPRRTESLPCVDLRTRAVTVQFEEFERVAFVNQILVGMWAYIDTTICSAIKEFVEPVIQENLPFPVSGFEFEKLALGDAPFQIRGVKHASLFDGVQRPPARRTQLRGQFPGSWNPFRHHRSRSRSRKRCLSATADYLASPF